MHIKELFGYRHLAVFWNLQLRDFSRELEQKAKQQHLKNQWERQTIIFTDIVPDRETDKNPETPQPDHYFLNALQNATSISVTPSVSCSKLEL